MRKYYRQIGISLAIIAIVCNFTANEQGDILYKMIYGGIATVLGIASCYLWSVSKGCSAFNALWGIISPLGFIPVLLLKDKKKENKNGK